MNTGVGRKMLWVTWEKQIRNRSMAKALEIPLYEVLSDRNRIMRYAFCIIRTLVIINRERPSIVICQNPSFVLTLFLVGVRRILGFNLVVDAHFGGVEAYNGSNIFQRVLDYCNRAADLVIVTNEKQAGYIRDLGGLSFVCPDPLPDLSEFKEKKEEVAGKVFFICSFDIDEPFLEVFQAAKILSSDELCFFVSGNYHKAQISPEDFPYVTFLGYVPEKEFYRHLFCSQLVLDLTDHNNCLVCGAYEGRAAGKPLILSDTKVLREYFSGGTVFTENKANEIAIAVKKAHAERERLVLECNNWVTQKQEEMRLRVASLNRIIEDL